MAEIRHDDKSSVNILFGGSTTGKTVLHKSQPFGPGQNQGLME